jgi:hypothetical protein
MMSVGPPMPKWWPNLSALQLFRCWMKRMANWRKSGSKCWLIQPQVTKATVTSSKTVDFSFRGPLGFEAHTVLMSVESDSPERCAFESVGGNIDLIGLIDFTEVTQHCTEVTLAVHYEIQNKLFAWLDRRLHFVDAFVTSELRRPGRFASGLLLYGSLRDPDRPGLVQAQHLAGAQ